MAITKKGTAWELLNCYWILFAFTYFLCGIGIFIAGTKTRVSRWKKQGLISTGILWAVGLTIGSLNSYKESQVASSVGDVLVVVTIIIFIWCIYKSFKIRKEYLIRLELVLSRNLEQKENEQLRERVKEKYNNKVEYEEVINNIDEDNYKEIIEDKKIIKDIQSQKDYEKENERTNFNDEPTEVINVNTCSLEELQRVPGVSIILAKKAVRLRDERNGFKNVEEFIKDIGIKEYYVDKVKKVISCEKKEKIEIKDTKTTGRMVDF